jgi:glutamate dehydrogenase
MMRGVSDGLLELVEQRIDGPEGEALEAFARAYLHRLVASSADPRPADALYAEVLGAFRFASARDGAPVAVRAFNPTAAEDGYATSGSVVETNTPDLPFLVDSVSSALRAEGLSIRRVLHPIIGTERGPNGRIARVVHPRDARTRESVMHFELDRRLDPERLAELEDTVRGVLGDVQRVVACEDELGRRLEHLEQVAREQAAHHEQEEIDEVVAFLHWLAEGAFVFLGYREDEVVDGTLRPVPGSGVGLLHDAAGPRRPGPPAGAELLCVDKTRRRSTVKRRARMDAIGVRRHGPDGEVVGESMLVGLFTSRAYAEPASQTPILHRKLKRILAAEDLIDGSHDFKAAVALYESFPKDELFAADTEDLRRAITALLALQGDESRLLGRRSTDGRTVSLIAAIPRASHTAALVRRMRALLEERFPSAAIEIDEALVEGERAQIHYTLHATEEDLPTSRSASCSARSSSWRAPGTTGCASISSPPTARSGGGCSRRAGRPGCPSTTRPASIRRSRYPTSSASRSS